MNLQQFLECERKGFDRLIHFQFSNKWKSIGLIGFVLVLTGLFISKNFDAVSQFRPMLRALLLVALLIVSISKDKQEDELVKLLRAQSYVFSFIAGVLYALIQPLVTFAVVRWLGGNELLQPLSSFQVLIFMLMIQLMIFHYLKSMR